MGMFDEDSGPRLNDVLSYALPVLLGAASGATPGTARAGQGILAGLNYADQARERARKEEQRKLYSTRLNDVLGATKDVTVPLPNPERIQDSLGDLDETSPFYREPLSQTKQDYVYPERVRRLGPLLEGQDPAIGLQLLTQLATKEAAPPHVFGSAETGYHALAPTGELTPLVPGVGRREATPPRPVFATQGGEAVNSVYNPDTKQWETSTRPVTPAPRQPLDPLQEQNLRSQIAERSARVERIHRLTNVANSPKATLGQLSASLNALVRERDSIETPDDEKMDINEAIRAIRGRLAQLGKGEAGQPGASEPAPGATSGRRPLSQIYGGK